MTLAAQLRGLLPPVAYDPNAAAIGAVIDAEAKALDAAVERAASLSLAMHPATAGEDIRDWERHFDLTPRPDAGQAERVQAVLAKLGEVGGLSVPYFVRLAAASGYRITINEPKPWRVGHSSVIEPLYLQDVLFVWLVHIDARPSGANERTDAALAQQFIDLKPAHTFCQFMES